MFFVDWGNYGSVRADQLREIPKEMLEMPFQVGTGIVEIKRLFLFLYFGDKFRRTFWSITCSNSKIIQSLA